MKEPKGEKEEARTETGDIVCVSRTGVWKEAEVAYRKDAYNRRMGIVIGMMDNRIG